MKAQLIRHKNKPVLIWKGDSVKGGAPVKGDTFASPYSLKQAKRLKKAGYKVPSLAEAYHYPGPYKNPRDCQRAMLKFHLEHHRCLNLSEMRTGKTAPSIWLIDIMMRYYGIKRILIVTPLPVILDTWKPEIFSIIPHVPTYYSIKGSENLKEALTEGRYNIVLVNPRKLEICCDELDDWDPELVIVDEFTEFKSHKSFQYDSLYRLMAKCQDYETRRKYDGRHRKAIFLSGTPVAQRPTDAWTILRFVNPETPKHFKAFRDQVMYRPNPEKSPRLWETIPNSEPVVAKLLQPSIRFLTEEVNDMPKHEFVDYRAEMGQAQAKMFKAMLRDFRAEGDGQVITSANAGDRLFKLLQICSGIIYGNEGDDPVMCGAPPKLEMLNRLVRETPKKTVVMTPWRIHQRYIGEYLEKQGYVVDYINGSVKGQKRQDAINRFQDGDTEVLVCQPRTTKHGLKLHAASLLVWFGAVVSNEEFIQGSARIRGPGTGSTVIAKFSCSDLEERRFGMLESKGQTQTRIVDVYREVIYG